MGVQLGFMGVQLGGKGHLGWFGGCGCGCGNFRAAAGGCHHACQMMEPRGCGCCSRLLACSSVPVTAVVVSAGQMPGLVMRPGGAAAARLREAGPGGSCCVSLGW
jgi:hypothetical protein